MNKKAKAFLFSCGIFVMPLSLAAQAQASSENMQIYEQKSAAVQKKNDGKASKSKLEGSTQAELLAQNENYAELEKLLMKQQELLEKQARQIEEQQKQIDDLKHTLEQHCSSLQIVQDSDKETESCIADGIQAETQEAPKAAETNITDTEKTAQAAENKAFADSTSDHADDQSDEAESMLAETEDPGPEPPSADEAPTESTAQASGQQPEMNPNISLILLGGAQAGGADDDKHKNTIYLQEAELAISAPVDPSVKAEAYISFPRDESPEIEEAFAQYSGFNGLQFRGGILRSDIGALNTVHTHALPQIDRPLNYTMFLGDEGLHNPGAELSYLLPLPWYSKVTASVSSRTGHEHSHEHEHEHDEESLHGDHDDDHDEDGDHEEEFSLFPKGGKNNPLFTARWENMAELNDDTTLSLGLTHASSSINSESIKTASLNGADLTLKWHPAEDSFKEFVWRSEYMNAKQKYQEGTEQKDKDLSGWYSYISYRINRAFRLGLRYDQADSPIIESGKTKRFSVNADFINNEWNSVRLQYNRTSPSWSKPYNELLLQWNVVIGPHGAHKY